MKLDRNIINELAELLKPLMEDERSRRSTLISALGNDAPVLQHITWSGSVRTFIPEMVCQLADYGEIEPGKQALWTLLEYVRSQVGINVQQRIDNLRPLIDVRSHSETPPAPSSGIKTSNSERLKMLEEYSQIRKAELTAEIRERHKEKRRFLIIKNKGNAEAREIKISINEEKLIDIAEHNFPLWSDLQKISSIPAGEERTLRLGYTQEMRHQVSINWSDDSEEQGLFEKELIALIDYQAELTPQTSIPTMPSLKRDQVFISYSHKDKVWLEKLQTMLKPLIRSNKISLWDDTRIKPGAKWKNEITQALAAAKVAVLMVSSNFLASDFIAEKELPPLLNAAEQEGLTIIWIYLSACLYEDSEIGEYQAAHDTAEPLDTLSPGAQNQVLRTIGQAIKAAATETSANP